MHKLSLWTAKTAIVETSKRCISTSSTLCSKKNFRKFYLPNQRGTRQFRERQASSDPLDIEIETYGVRQPTVVDEHGNTVVVPELIPELIVPDLTGFELQPYVSYRTKPFTQTRFTTEDLFYAVYSEKIINDWNNKLLNEDGTPKHPSEDEQLNADVAFLRARRTGADIFCDGPRHSSYDMVGEKPDLENDDGNIDAEDGGISQSPQATAGDDSYEQPPKPSIPDIYGYDGHEAAVDHPPKF